jgi:hypothetical protein
MMAVHDWVVIPPPLADTSKLTPSGTLAMEYIPLELVVPVIVALVPVMMDTVTPDTAVPELFSTRPIKVTVVGVEPPPPPPPPPQPAIVSEITAISASSA